MDLSLKQNLIKEAQLLLINNPQNYAHDITHHYRTWLNAIELFNSINETFSADIIELICWWHDVQISKKDDSENSVTLSTAQYLSNKFDGNTKEIIYDSIKNHEFGSIPNFIEGKILQDADKLEILSMERVRIAIEYIKTGKMSKDYFYNAYMDIYENWLPKMPKAYNFEISRKIHEKKLKEAYNEIIINLNIIKNL